MEKLPPFKVALDAVSREFGHSLDFSSKVLKEAKKISHDISPETWGERVDLCAEPIVTIDGETARDFDDAVSVDTLPEGRWRLLVSIADVSHYVRPGSAIDQEAYHRATSAYFPDRCIPMLPEELSNNLCSLVPQQDRLTMTAEMIFDREGRREESRFYRSVIRSAARLTYTLVHRILDLKDQALRQEYAPLLGPLERMEQLFRLLRTQRLKRGTLDFDLPEPQIVMDLEERNIERIVKAERYASHRLIEEFMIAANEAVAEFLEGSGKHSIYRVHETPNPEKAEEFMSLLHNMGFQVPRMKGHVFSPKTFAAVIETIRGKPEERLLNTLLLRTMKQAYYDVKNKGHFGLASRSYTHFTSPIRRYPDLLVHRILGQQLKSDQPRMVSRSVLSKMAEHCSERERNAMKTEWATRDLAAVYFMQNKIGEVYQGIIANVTKFGVFVELKDYFVQGLLGLRNLTDDYYIFNEKKHCLQGKKNKQKFQIGDEIRVKVGGVNLVRRWLDFSLEKPI